MNVDIVVAQYRENIEWLQYLKHNNIRNIMLYKKYKHSKIFHKQLDLKYLNPKIITQTLPNTGRESHTYLTYCVEFYNDLPDVVFFVQGNPFAHGFGDKAILHWIRKIDRINFTHTNNYHNSHFLVGMPNGRMRDWYGPTDPSQYDMRTWFYKYIDADKNIFQKHCYIYFGANFAVSKKQILSRTMNEYQTLIDEEFTDKVNPEAGHFMERSWYYLFNLHKI